jgi:UDP-2,4-diacetamido-2,4,6-trideoxy-beta-L-altropyranose hydrolase
VGKNLGEIDHISTETLVEAITLFLRDFASRAEASDNGRRIVDGRGAQRVMGSMEKPKGFRVRLRAATMDDCRTVWEWANEPAVRVASFNSEPIKWDEHVEWFTTRVRDPSCLYYIVLSDIGIPIGQVRFDKKCDKAEINVSIGSSFRRQGFGTEAIRMASERLFRETQVSGINANIKLENKASIHAFAEAGYEERGVTLVRGHQALQMTLERRDNT